MINSLLNLVIASSTVTGNDTAVTLHFTILLDLDPLANPFIYQMGAGCYLSVVYIVSNRQLSDLNPNSYQTAPYFYGQISDFS